MPTTRLDSNRSETAYQTAYYCLLDTLACGFQALKYPACTKLLGPVVPGAMLKGGARVPGTSYELDPITAAFNIGAMIRWLDFNDTWLAAEWGHPSDNLGAILAVADYLARNGKPLKVRDVLTGMIKAHEIQGVLALENSFNRVGLDHVLLVRVASTAVVTAMLGGTREQIINAVSNAWVDGGALRTYRHAPEHRLAQELGRRRRDQPRRAACAVRAQGRDGLPLGADGENLGFPGRAVPRRRLRLPQALGSYVMENVLFKISYPGRIPCPDRGRGGHDACIRQCATGSMQIERIVIETQEPGCASSTRPDRWRTRPIAITASSTWWPSRCCSAG